MKTLLLLMLPLALWQTALILPGRDPHAAGERAYAQGDYRKAFEAFQEAVINAGDGAAPELLYNHALAALRAGLLLDAEVTAEKAAARGGREFSALRDFLLGNTAFMRSRKAEVLADEPDAKPSAFDAAIAHAEQARLHWQRAAASRDDWAEARRNVERALLALEALKKKREAAEQRRLQTKDKQFNEKQLDPSLQSQLDDAGDTEEQDSKVEPLLTELATEQLVQSLLEKLERKEQEKLETRRAARRARGAEVERDW